MKQLKEYTAQGYRVLAMAWKPIAAESYDEISKGPREGAEKDLRFAGLIILENRLKDHAKETILTLRNADMKVVMITGRSQITFNFLRYYMMNVSIFNMIVDQATTSRLPSA